MTGKDFMNAVVTGAAMAMGCYIVNRSIQIVRDPYERTAVMQKISRIKKRLKKGP